MARLRLLGPARDVAGCGAIDDLPGDDVGAVLDAASARFGDAFDRLLARSAVWVNGEPSGRDRGILPGDEVAVLPPVSGG